MDNPPPPTYSTEVFSHKVVTIGRYYPYRIKNEEGEKVRNHAFDAFSGAILDLKNENDSKHAKAVTSFATMLTNLLNRFDFPGEALIATIVPSHQKAKWSKGLENVLRQTTPNKYTLNVRPYILKRTLDIDKLSSGGDRSIETHLESIALNEPFSLANSTVLLLDDVWTSGNSIRACRRLLLEAGVDLVVCVALGKTAHEDANA